MSVRKPHLPAAEPEWAGVRLQSGVTNHPPTLELLPLRRIPIDRVLVALPDRNHADDQLGLPHLVDQAVAHGPQLDFVAVLRAVQAGGGHMWVVQPFG